MSPAEKLAEIKRLGALRRASVVPEGCYPLAYFHDGYYETEFVSPWTNSACNVEPEIAIVLQDWCGRKYLEGSVKPIVRELGYDPNLPTNSNLKKLLAGAGFSLEEVFGTNAFPWIKSGPMDSKLEPKWLSEAIRQFAIPQLKIVGPKVAVLFGKTVRNAVGAAFGVSKAKSLLEAIENPFSADGMTFVTVAHTGWKIHRHRGWDNSVNDWRRIGEMLR